MVIVILQRGKGKCGNFVPRISAMKTLLSPILSINDFFATYAHALEGYDTKTMAFLYNSPCTMISDDTTTVFNDPSKLEGFFNVGAGFYRKFGIVHVRHQVWTKRDWTGKIMNVKVNWQYFDGLNAPVYDCDYQYVLKTDKHGQWKIILSVSLNEKERVDAWKKKAGL